MRQYKRLTINRVARNGPAIEGMTSAEPLPLSTIHGVVALSDLITRAMSQVEGGNSGDRWRSRGKGSIAGEEYDLVAETSVRADADNLGRHREFAIHLVDGVVAVEPAEVEYASREDGAQIVRC